MPKSTALLRYTLGGIGVVQLILGIVFVFAPNGFATLIAAPVAPDWANWIFIMFGARSLGFAYGMFLSLRNPAAHLSWLRAMIGIQAIDWLGTIIYVATGSLTLFQVSGASFLPLLFIAVLSLRYPRPAK